VFDPFRNPLTGGDYSKVVFAFAAGLGIAE
jgi:hypothetical protein